LQNELREGGKNKDPQQAAIPCTFVSAMSAVNGFALAKSIAERDRPAAIQEERRNHKPSSGDRNRQPKQGSRSPYVLSTAQDGATNKAESKHCTKNSEAPAPFFL
jgi:hypothetical protein